MQSGLGLRPELFDAIFEQRPALGFLEAHSENYFGDSIARAKLLELREHYDISLHGVGLSLGRADHLNTKHLRELKHLVDEINPMLVSEHLAWSAYSHRHVPDLLPLPLTEQSLAIMCQHVEQMQDVLQRKIYIENPSNYLLFDRLQIPEPEFLNALATRTGCGLLVDLNNIYVSATNLKRDANEYVNQLNSQLIGQYHLAGYTKIDRHGEAMLIDTHNQTVDPQVWELFGKAVQKHGARPTLLEWDSDFPELAVLLVQCQRAEEILASSGEKHAPSKAHSESLNTPSRYVSAKQDSFTEAQLDSTELRLVQGNFLDGLLGLDDKLSPAIDAHKHRLWIYQNNVFAATREYLEEVYPALLGLVGDKFFKQMAQVFVQNNPPSEGDVYLFGEDFDSVIVQFDALQEMPYLVDLMHYEWALHTAYFASLANCIDPNKTEQSELLSMPLCFNPSVAIIHSKYPIYEIHRQSLPGHCDEVAIELNQSQDSLIVYKQEHAVVSRLLNEDEAIFVDVLANSENILQSIERIQGSMSAESLATNLGLMFELKLLMPA
ncbi:MAG: hypothetical protein ACI9WC_002335 [Arenicella sp.]|jgi:uncharacterized protein (UPF0276 family)